MGAVNIRDILCAAPLRYSTYGSSVVTQRIIYTRVPAAVAVYFALCFSFLFFQNSLFDPAEREWRDSFHIHSQGAERVVRHCIHSRVQRSFYSSLSSTLPFYCRRENPTGKEHSLTRFLLQLYRGAFPSLMYLIYLIMTIIGKGNISGRLGSTMRAHLAVLLFSSLFTYWKQYGML